MFGGETPKHVQSSIGTGIPWGLVPPHGPQT